jgi:hypothetical protein
VNAAKACAKHKRGVKLKTTILLVRVLDIGCFLTTNLSHSRGERRDRVGDRRLSIVYSHQRCWLSALLSCLFVLYELLELSQEIVGLFLFMNRHRKASSFNRRLNKWRN